MALCALTHLPAPLHLIKFERLRPFAQCASKGYASLKHLLDGGVASSHCWLAGTLEDVRWLVDLRPVPSAIAMRDQDLSELFAALRGSPSGLSGLLKPAWSQAVRSVMAQDLAKFAPAARFALQCPACGKTCKGNQGLQVHLSRKHGELIQAHFYAPDHQCHACKRPLQTRERVLRHLSRRSPESATARDSFVSPGGARGY